MLIVVVVAIAASSAFDFAAHGVAVTGDVPTGLFAIGLPDVGWSETGLNWLLAGAGNLVGAVVFVATSYWYLFLRDQPDPAAAPSAPDAERA